MAKAQPETSGEQSSPIITVSMAELQRLIAEGIENAERTKPGPVQTPTDATDAEPVNRADLTSLVETLKDQMPPKKVSFARYKPVSPFNPRGVRNRKFSRELYQNGQRTNPKLLFDEEIKLLETLPPGRFIDKLVTVEIHPSTDPDSKDQVHIYWPSRTHDQRMAVAMKVRSFVGLLRMIHEEHKNGPAPDSIEN